MMVGLGRYALSKAVEYACTRRVFNVPTGAYQGLAHPVAIAKTETPFASLHRLHWRAATAKLHRRLFATMQGCLRSV